MSDVVRTEQVGRVLLITLNRPQVMNAINADLAHGVVEAIARLDRDSGLVVGVLTGAGERAFSAGMDLKAFSGGEDVREIMTFMKNGSTKPLIAAVEGLALAGGLELALSCDLLVAARGAKLGVPEVKVGLFASAGGVLRLPARVGFGRAMEMVLTGDPITAEEAFDLGLVARLTDSGKAADEAMALAARIASNAPLAVAVSKRLIRETIGRTEAEYWQVQDPLEAELVASDDAREGPLAFAEKRDPQWTGT